VDFIGLSIGGMIGQAFAIEHGTNLISALWSDTRLVRRRCGTNG
jgi:hypothetical protein